MSYSFSWHSSEKLVSNPLTFEGGTLITSYDEPSENTTIIGDDSYQEEFHHFYGYHNLWTDDYINITRCELVIFKDGKVVFNETKPFYMGNYKEDVYVAGLSDNDKSHDSSSSNVDSIYVASSNSNKFHEPYCSQAQRINDANKLSFSGRDEAINAGYEPCGICYP